MNLKRLKMIRDGVRPIRDSIDKDTLYKNIMAALEEPCIGENGEPVKSGHKLIVNHKFVDDMRGVDKRGYFYVDTGGMVTEAMNADSSASVIVNKILSGLPEGYAEHLVTIERVPQESHNRKPEYNHYKCVFDDEALSESLYGKDRFYGKDNKPEVSKRKMSEPEGKRAYRDEEYNAGLM